MNMKNNRLSGGNATDINCDEHKGFSINVVCCNSRILHLLMTRQLVDNGYVFGVSFKESSDNNEIISVVDVYYTADNFRFVAWDVENNDERIRDMVKELQWDIFGHECTSLILDHIDRFVGIGEINE